MQAMARRLFLAALTAAFAAGAAAEVEIRIVYDNTAAEAGFTEDWGFSAAVSAADARILFDSGADADVFMRHLQKLGIDPASITAAVISHHHADHRGGIFRFVLKNRSVPVYFLDSFPRNVFELAWAVGMRLRRVKGPAEIAPGVFTTGEIDGRIPEQALVVESPLGLVILVGCGHPGVAKMVETAARQHPSPKIRLVLGGFHMMRWSEEQIQTEIERLKALGVEQVAPAHCTGEKAKRLFRRAWGRNYLAAGAGRRIVVR